MVAPDLDRWQHQATKIMFHHAVTQEGNIFERDENPKHFKKTNRINK